MPKNQKTGSDTDPKDVKSEQTKARDQARKGKAPSAGTQYGAKGPRVRLMLIFMVAMGAMVYGVPRLAERYPEKFVWDLPTLGSLLKTTGFIRDGAPAQLGDIVPTRPDEIVRRPKEENERGMIFRAPLVAWADRENLPVTHIVQGFEQTTKESFPSRIRGIAVNRDCNIRQPRNGERVMSVNVENSPTQSQIRQHMNSDLVRVAQRITDKPELAQNEAQNIFGGDMKVVDLFVTETSAPVYLVLQSLENVIWNVHRDPNSSIAHIVMVGASSAGISLADDDIRYEAVLTGGFETDEPGCAMHPWRKPTADWSLNRLAIDTPDEYGAILDAYISGHAAYEAWYQGKFGVDTLSYAINVRAAAQVLVGPRPLSPLEYRPYNQTTIAVTNADHLIVGSERERNTRSSELLSETLGQDIDVTALAEALVQ